MKKKKFPGFKTRKIAKIVIFIFIGSGVLFLLYLTAVNIISEAKEADILSEWEEQKEKSSEEVMVKDSDVISDEPESLSDDTEKEIAGYAELTAEDFFPLKIIIPKINLERISYEGADNKTLEQGPGHIEETPLPGDIGRCTISGHRTTYGSPFLRVDELEDGDLIYLETINGELFTYVVTGRDMVNPEDVYILEGSYRKELLLTTCHPKYSSAKRLIIIAELLNLHPLEIGFSGGR